MSKNELNALIGRNIRYYRKKLGLTQEELAERVGVSTSFCANIERGGRSMSVQKLTKFADELKVSVDCLVRDPEMTEPEHAEAIRTLLSTSSAEVGELAEEIVRLLVSHESE